ncbi:LuxR C-terminal-related transcriptional regulator [Microbacterium sp. GXS0129]|uniref:helix-turn-helix transcriptional regulator n=1 Tax=Microbacterium sp. GXS0129 TaxID=3377836 RepID=UPI00383A0D00
MELLTRAQDIEGPPVLTASEGSAREPLALLRQLNPDIADDVSTEQIARSMMPPTRLVVRNAHRADAQSLRVLAFLAKRGLTKLVLTLEESGAALPDELRTLTIHRLAPITSEQIGELVGARYAATVLPAEARRMLADAQATYRTVRWLVDRAQDAGCVSLLSTTLLFARVPPEAPGPWRLGEGGDTSIERAAAIAGELPLEWARATYGEAEIVDLQEGRRLVVADGQIRPESPAHGAEITAHMLSERRRVVVRSLLEDDALVSNSDAGLTESAAARLSDAARAAGLDFPSALVSRARRGYLAEGRAHAAALLPLPEEAGPEDLLLHALALALAANHLRLTALSSAGFSEDQLLEFAVVLTIAEFRGAPPQIADRIEVIVAALPQPHAAVVEALRSITLTEPEFDWDDLAAATMDARQSVVARSFALRILALRALMLGQPQTAADRLTQARALATLPVQYAMDEIIASAVLLFAPDVQLDAERVILPPDRIPTQDLFLAMIALYRGDLDTGAGYVHSALQMPDADAHFLTPILHGFASFAASLLKRPEAAERHLEALRSAPSALPLLMMARQFTEALAVVNIESIDPDVRTQAGHDVLERLGDQAEHAGFRALAILARLGGAFILDQRRDSPLLQKVVASALEDAPLEGIFRTYSLAAHAFLSDDTLTLASIAVSLHNQGFLLDAVGLSTHLPLSSSGLSRTVERAITRLANFRVDRVADRTGLDRILTPRETEIARLAAEGLTDREISVRLGIAQRTVNTHVTRILRKLGVPSRNRISGSLP